MIAVSILRHALLFFLVGVNYRGWEGQRAWVGLMQDIPVGMISAFFNLAKSFSLTIHLFLQMGEDVLVRFSDVL